MTIVYILAAILIFGVLIAVHELGHFLAAKLCGVRVNEFSIGMGPLIWHKETEETQYSLRLLPIGGFCAMEGEDEDSGDERSLGRQGFWKKVVIFAAGSFMNFLAGFLIILAVYSGAQGFPPGPRRSLRSGTARLSRPEIFFIPSMGSGCTCTVTCPC